MMPDRETIGSKSFWVGVFLGAVILTIIFGADALILGSRSGWPYLLQCW